LISLYKNRFRITTYNNGLGFNLIHSFVSAVSNGVTYYYAMQYMATCNMLVYSEAWVFQRIVFNCGDYNAGKVGYGACFPLTINGFIFVTSDNLINKYDSSLNLQKQVTQYGGSGKNSAFRGIVLNSVDQQIYVADFNNWKINIYDQSLNYISQFSSNSPFFMAENNGKIYRYEIRFNILFNLFYFLIKSCDYSGSNIDVYQNQALIQKITTQCTSRPTSILFDNHGFMFVLCESPAFIYLYDTNGIYTGLSLATCSKAFYMQFDSKDRLVVTCYLSIDIYC
jgi:hypothetical protein